LRRISEISDLQTNKVKTARLPPFSEHIQKKVMMAHAGVALAQHFLEPPSARTEPARAPPKAEPILAPTVDGAKQRKRKLLMDPSD
jgi:hypothetical protein